MARSQISWGLDVGTTSLKAIKLARAGDKVTVEAFDVVEHEKFLSEPDVDKDAIIRVSLARFLERNPIRSDSLFIGVPGSQTFARFVKLPPVEPRKIPEIVRFEAIQQIPFPLDQVNWDYQTFQNPESPDVEVGIFAMKKELVAQVLGNFQNAKVAVAGVQMSPLAVFNAVEYDGMTGGKGSVVLDIGAEHTDLIFVDHGRLWLRTINIGGNNFTDALAKSFRLSFHKAEELKKTAATSKYARQVYQSMRPVFADLVTEIQRSIGFYNSSHRDSRLERVIGMGNPFKLPNLQKYLAQNLSVEVVRLESFKKVSTEGKLAPGLNEHILGMPAAYGLALQGLDLAQIDTNLLPTEIARQMLWKKKRPWFVAAAALLVIGVGSAVVKTKFIDEPAFAQAELSKAASENQAMIGTISTLRDTYHRIENTYDKDHKEVLALLNLSEEHAIWPHVLNDIFTSLPQADPANAASLSAANMHEHKEIILKSFSPEYSDALDGVAGNRGFTITISGYTPFNVPDPMASRALIRDFLKTIGDKSPDPAAGAKHEADPPYYYKIRTVPTPILADNTIDPTTTDLVWGNAPLGPFASVFVPKLLGIKETPPATQPAPGDAAMAPLSGQPPVIVDHPTAPVEPGGASMVGDEVFTFVIDVHLRHAEGTKRKP